jgi:hypothetical protein
VTGGLHGGPIVARRNVLSYMAALLQTMSRRPVSGLASDVLDVNPIAFPRICAVALVTGCNLLTVAGAAPESHRLPVSPG